MVSEVQLHQQTANENAVYQIKIKGHIGLQWSSWFNDLQVVLDEKESTTLTGPIVDQAELYGLLKKIRNLGLTLISVICLSEMLNECNEGIGYGH